MTTAPEKNAPAREPGAGDGVLAEPEWLEAHLDDPTVRVVEVDVSKLAHEQGHIDGAVLWDIYAELKDANYQLAGTAAMERLLARSGITPDSTVVFYGYGPAMGFWLMKLYGHADVRILNCSRDAWRAEGRRWSSQQISPAATSYPLRGQDGQLRAGHTEVAGAIDDPATTIVDVRSEAEYQGRAVLAVRRHGARRPRGSRPVRGPPAHRRPLRRARVVPRRRRPPRHLLRHRPRRRRAG